MEKLESISEKMAKAIFSNDFNSYLEGFVEISSYGILKEFYASNPSGVGFKNEKTRTAIESLKKVFEIQVLEMQILLKEKQDKLNKGK